MNKALVLERFDSERDTEVFCVVLYWKIGETN